MGQNIFRPEDIPYKTLESFGISRKMLEDLPMDVLDNILSGETSPALPVTVTDPDGNSVRARSRFRLVVTADEKPDIVFFPVLTKAPVSHYPEQMQERLLSGNAAVVDTVDMNGRPSKAFIQIDPETRQVLSVPTPVIARNILTLSRDFNIGDEGIKALTEGGTVTFEENGDDATAGIDLNDESGIRVCRGDADEWRLSGKREWNKYSFGLYGCWVLGDDGDLDYVSEESYSDELWDEQRRSAQRAMGGLHK